MARLLRSFQGMRIESSGLMTTGDAACVIASGENAAGPWETRLTGSTSQNTLGERDPFRRVLGRRSRSG